MLNKDKFNEFCNKVEQMCKGIAITAKHYDQPISGDIDFILSMDRKTTADAILHAFEPAAIQFRTRHGGSIVEFQVKKLSESAPILTEVELEAAHTKIFDNLHKSVMNETGRLGICLKKVSESTGKSQENIKEIIEGKISELRDEFNSKATYVEKNQTLLQLREFYDTIRTEDGLANLITENDNSMRP